ncbi:hypothetical protein SESBI_02388 [Sesbania bispinosa]|nr:hypothetical protein SESBI_02388 [Sesbania bispinosa]
MESSHPGGQSLNPNLLHGSAINGEEDLYGDWIAVSKSRKNQKFRGPEHSSRGKDNGTKKGNNDKQRRQ